MFLVRWSGKRIPELGEPRCTLGLSFPLSQCVYHERKVSEPPIRCCFAANNWIKQTKVMKLKNSKRKLHLKINKNCWNSLGETKTLVDAVRSSGRRSIGQRKACTNYPVIMPLQKTRANDERWLMKIDFNARYPYSVAFVTRFHGSLNNFLLSQKACDSWPLLQKISMNTLYPKHNGFQKIRSRSYPKQNGNWMKK